MATKRTEVVMLCADVVGVSGHFWGFSGSTHNPATVSLTPRTPVARSASARLQAGRWGDPAAGGYTETPSAFWVCLFKLVCLKPTSNSPKWNRRMCAFSSHSISKRPVNIKQQNQKSPGYMISPNHQKRQETFWIRNPALFLKGFSVWFGNRTGSLKT